MKHNISHEENLAHALDLALELERKGVPADEILSRFPEFRSDLKPLLFLMSGMKKSAKGIMPKEELLSRILTDLPERVTDRRAARLNMGEHSRTSFIQVIAHTMSSFKFAVPAGAVIMLLLFIGLGTLGPQEPGELSLKVDDLETELRSLESDAAQDTGIEESARSMTAPATFGAPLEPQPPAVEKAGVASEGEELQADFSDFDEFNQNDAEIDRAFSELF